MVATTRGAVVAAASLNSKLPDATADIGAVDDSVRAPLTVKPLEVATASKGSEVVEIDPGTTEPSVMKEFT